MESVPQQTSTDNEPAALAVDELSSTCVLAAAASPPTMVYTPPTDEDGVTEAVDSPVNEAAAAVAGEELGSKGGSDVKPMGTYEREEEDGRLPDEPLFEATEEVPPEFQCPRIPIMVLVLLVSAAFSQSFSSTCISLFINMDLGYGPVEVTRYWMYIGYVGWFQPLIGAVSDWFVIFREKRRPLFVLCVIGNIIIYSIFCFKPESTAEYTTFVVISIVSNACTMGIYIPLNGILVEVGRTDGESQEESVARVSAIMSKAMVFRSIGSLAATVLHTCLVIRLSVHTMLGVSALTFLVLLPLVMLTPRALFLRTAAQQPNFYKRVQETCVTVRRGFNIRDVRSDGFCFLLVLIFVFVYCLMPDAQSVYYNYLYGHFLFEPWFYSMNQCIGYLGSIVGAYFFSLWMDYRAKREHRGGLRTSIFFIFTIGCIAWAVAYVTNLLLCTGFITDVLHIPPEVYVPIDNFFMMMFVRFAFMPTIIMAAEHAPKNFEATAFEVFSVASMGGGTVSALLTSFIAEKLGITREDYSPLWILLVISIACKLAPIPAAYFLPERHHHGPEGEEEEGGDFAEQGCLVPAEGFAVCIEGQPVEQQQQQQPYSPSKGGDKDRRCHEPTDFPEDSFTDCNVAGQLEGNGLAEEESTVASLPRQRTVPAAVRQLEYPNNAPH